MQVGAYVVLAKIIDIDTNKKWCYISCDKCLTRVEHDCTKYFCENCDTFIDATKR